MEIRQLRYFEAVARTSHFTHAAEELGITQPGLSLQVQRLEQELGGKLFERVPRGARLTELGQVLLPSARRVLAEIESAMANAAEVTSGHAGRVSLGSQQSLTAAGLLPEVLHEFQQTRPGVDVTMREDRAATVLELVRTGELDLALLMLPETGEQDDELSTERLFTEDIVFVVGPDHPRAATTGISVHDLAADTFIAFNEGAGLRTLLERSCKEAGYAPRIGYESDALSSIRAFAAAGLGIAVLPEPVVRAPGPPLVELTTDVKLARTISLVTAANRHPSAAATSLAELLRRRLGSR